MGMKTLRNIIMKNQGVSRREWDCYDGPNETKKFRPWIMRIKRLMERNKTRKD